MRQVFAYSTLVRYAIGVENNNRVHIDTYKIFYKKSDAEVEIKLLNKDRKIPPTLKSKYVVVKVEIKHPAVYISE